MIFDYEKDWFMRQISDMVRVAALIVFGKERPEYQLREEQEGISSSDDLYRHLTRLYDEQDYRQALAVLSGSLSAGRPDDLLAALDFYDRANRLTEEELAAGGISREELLDSLQTVITLYELPL